MKDQQQSDSVIKSHCAMAMMAGVIPLPMLDVVGVTAIQLDMVKQMARIHKVDYNLESGKALISSLTGASFARFGASALKIFFGLGTIMGGVAMSVLSGASTYAIGKVFDQHFSSGGSLVDFDLDAGRRAYDHFVKEGKSVVESIRRDDDSKSPQEKALATLERLGRLKEAGHISNEEFEEQKSRLLKEIIA